MKHLYISLLALLFCIPCWSQQVYYLEIEPNQKIEVPGGTDGTRINYKNRSGVVVLGGIQNRDGIGMFIEANGNKLVIDRMTPMMDGTREVVLRREDGRLFYNLFTTIKGRLRPMTLERTEEDSTRASDSLPGGRL